MSILNKKIHQNFPASQFLKYIYSSPFPFLAIAICPNQNRRAAVAAVIHAPAPAPNHTSAVILAIPVTVHCRKVPKTDIIQDQAPQKIMVDQEAPQTEMKAWMIKLTLLRYVTSRITKQQHFLDLRIKYV